MRMVNKFGGNFFLNVLLKSIRIMKKILFFLSAVVMLIIVCVQTNSSSTDLLLENVEALSAGEVHF